MDDSGLITTGLPIALAIIMFGLGMSLTPDDFRRVAREPKAVVVALAVQVLILPVLAFGLVVGFDLPPMLAIVHFDYDGNLGLQFGKVAQVVAIVLAPVVIGMYVRSRWSRFAQRADRPVRLFSIGVLVVVAVGALVGERDDVAEYARQVGVVTGLFCVLSLAIGYAAARLLRLSAPKAIACSMEIGIHNTTVALTIALSVLDNAEIAIPAAVYSILMYLIAPAFGFLVTRRSAQHALRSRSSSAR